MRPRKYEDLRTTHPRIASTNIALNPPITPATIDAPGWLGWDNKSGVGVDEVVVVEEVLKVVEGELVCVEDDAEVLGRAPVSVIALGKVYLKVRTEMGGSYIPRGVGFAASEG